MERIMEEKPKLAELIVEGEILQQRQITENQAEEIRIQERLAKKKARSEVFEAMKRKRFTIDHSEIIRGSKKEGV